LSLEFKGNAQSFPERCVLPNRGLPQTLRREKAFEAKKSIYASIELMEERVLSKTLFG
jgi:hypothetical protein